MMKNTIGSALVLALFASATPALAKDVEFKPLIDTRLRYESVEQRGLAREADAVTARMRAGFELKKDDFSFLAEAEATLAIHGKYNSTVNGLAAYPVVADPENIELNRLQIQYRGLPKTVVTAGRQRINIGDQRFVGAVGWRQNEQTFDAVRIETAALGPVTADLTYSWSNRTIFGIDSPIQALSGDNIFANVGAKLGPVTVKGFSYLIDQDAPGRRQLSSQTYGMRAAAGFKLGAKAKLNLVGSYARQSDWHTNPNDYSADYWLGEAALEVSGITITGGYEVLGADSGAAFTSFQTPLATLHKFQGWADKFLVTPPNGIRDLYASGGYSFKKAGPLGPVSILVAWHQFNSDRLSIDYGNEWNAQIGFKPMKKVGMTFKFADYDAKGFATGTRKFWVQLDYVL